MSVTIPKRSRFAEMSAPVPVPVPANNRDKTVSAIITCHNYGQWLEQCIESCLSQSHSFACIVVVDDSSTDNTAEVAALYRGRVKYLRVDFGDVSKARNAGFDYLSQHCRTDFVLPVDADNWLPSEYVASLLPGFTDAKGGVVYGVRWPHCEKGRPIDDKPLPLVEFNHDQLRVKNFADNCALIRWEALEQVRGWNGDKFGMEDWLLWLRITAAGWSMKGINSPFCYRMHIHQAHQKPDPIGRRARAFEYGCKVAVVTLFGGRKLHNAFDVLNTLEWAGEMHHVALDNSGDAQFKHGLLSLLAGAYRPFAYAECRERALPQASAGEMSNSAELRRAHAYTFQQHMTRLYTQARGMIPADADFVLTLEDDVTPPPDGLRALARVLAQDASAGMVAGVVPSRFAKSTGDQPALIAWHGESLARKQRFKEFDATKSPLAATFGFTLWRREVFDGIAFRPCWNWGTKEPAFDFSAGEDVRRNGWRIKLAPVNCIHEG